MTNTILRLPAVEHRTGLKKNTIYRRMKKDEFPKNFPIGGCTRTVGWPEAEIDAYIEKHIPRTEVDGSIEGQVGSAPGQTPALSEAPIEPINTREQRPNQPRLRSPTKMDPWIDLLIAGFREDCEKENMTDMDALCAWRMGIEAYKTFRRLGGTLPHDTRRNKR